MKYISLDLTALSPLSIRADHSPTGVNNASYIAGTTLAGSLASAYRSFYPEQSSDFERLFLSGQIQYPDLYPASIKDNKTERDRSQEHEVRYSPVYPFPKTAQSCKRFSDFRLPAVETEGEPGHGVRDTLLDWAAFELGKETYEALTRRLLKKENRYCRICGKAMNHLSGFYRCLESNPADQQKHMVKTHVSTRVQTHTGINRATGTVQEGILYSRQVFEEQSRFQGVVKLPDDEELVRLFTRFIERIGKSELVRIGTGRTRGMGKVQLNARMLPDDDFSFPQFRQRLEKFDQLVRSLGEASEAKFYFALTLHAPAILRDSRLRYRGSIDEETLTGLLGSSFPVNSFELIYQAAGVQRVTGWNDLWGTPRMQEFAIETGSVFLFGYKSEAEDDLYQALYWLEEKGIGERRTEGFGRVSVSDPFHQEEKLR